MTYAELKSQAVSALLELARGGVSLLIAEGVQGRRNDPCNCPVARYLTQRTGRTWEVHNTAAVHGKYAANCVVYLPAEVLDLAWGFDSGELPELEES